jgi:UDP-N-acetylglucosamine 2-epimerase (non-hydrolysing)
MARMKVLIVMGTRPEIIKCWPVYRCLKDYGHYVYVYHTDQNFTKHLKEWIFRDYPYKEEDFLPYLKNCNFDYVLVQGDTWSTLDGALFALKNNIKLGHIEAGLRSGDMRMIEEQIRIRVDKVSDLLFAPTRQAYDNLVPRDGLYLVGNPIYDLLKDETKNFRGDDIIVTLHRPETVDNPLVLENTIDGIKMVANIFDKNIKFYCHPRTQDRYLTGIRKLKPISHKKMVEKLKFAWMCITDSGGLQEECAILNVPCVTVKKRL